MVAVVHSYWHRLGTWRSYGNLLLSSRRQQQQQQWLFVSTQTTVQNFSTNTTRLSKTRESKTTKKNTESAILPLYQRNKDRIAMPRAALGLSALNTAYWLWYTLDFIPAVNSSPLEHLHIDPNIGWGALGLGITINAITALYPSLLISRLDYDPFRNQLLLYRHQLPFLNQSTKATAYALGDLTVDPTDSELKKILGDLKGDWIKYKGHLALRRKNESIPLLLEVQSGRVEVKDGEALLQAMMRPMTFSAAQSARFTRTKRLDGSKRKQKRSQ